jgi:ElaB/YqjD/DUF883 family membrane-anchored ribosome-binding protein
MAVNQDIDIDQEVRGMKTAAVMQATDQVKEGLYDISEKVKDFSDNVNERWKDTRDDLQRRARKFKTATENKMEEARFRIKTKPLTAVSAAAGGAFLLGIVIGWATTRRRRGFFR